MNRYFAWAWDALRHGGWAPVVIFGSHVIAVKWFDAYTPYPRLDVPMHFLGGVAIAYFFHCASLAASAHGIIGPFHRVTHPLLVFALTCTAAVFWEFAEFLTDRFLHTQAQLGLQDTLGDMLLGISGGLTLVVVTSVIARAKPDARKP